MKDQSKKKTKDDGLEKIRQNIFTAKTDKEKKMWEAILRKLTDERHK